MTTPDSPSEPTPDAAQPNPASATSSEAQAAAQPVADPAAAPLQQPVTPTPPAAPPMPTAPQQASVAPQHSPGTMPQQPYAAPQPQNAQPGAYAQQPYQQQGGYPPQPPYQQQGGYAQQPVPQRKTNTLAVISLISAFFINVVGIICGQIALRQIKRTGDKGRGLAIAGIVIGYVSLVLSLLIVVLVVVFFSQVAKEIQNDLNVAERAPIEMQLDDEATGTDGDAVSAEYSAEFCAVISDPPDFDNLENEEVGLDFLQQLATIPSPHQSVYQRFYNYAIDPDPFTLDIAEEDALINEYIEATTADSMACF